MSPFLQVLENEVQITALIFMAAVYIIRLTWLFRFKPSPTRTLPQGSERSGIGFSLLSVGLPKTMESIRRNPWFYAQFVIFHVGVAMAIAATFIIPYFPRLFHVRAVAQLFQAVLGLAFCAGLLRLVRRLKKPVLRLVSTPDDYLSLILMIAFFGAGVVAVPRSPGQAEWPLILFFALTAFFLVYVPFSKICHYLYYPFARYYLGKTLGHRGVYPLKVYPTEGRPAPIPGRRMPEE